MLDPQTVLQNLRDNLTGLKAQSDASAGETEPILFELIEAHQQAISLTEQLLAGRLARAAWGQAVKPSCPHWLQPTVLSPGRDSSLKFRLRPGLSHFPPPLHVLNCRLKRNMKW